MLSFNQSIFFSQLTDKFMGLINFLNQSLVPSTGVFGPIELLFELMILVFE
jgi:hypothetical protein